MFSFGLRDTKGPDSELSEHQPGQTCCTDLSQFADPLQSNLGSMHLKQKFKRKTWGGHLAVIIFITLTPLPQFPCCHSLESQSVTFLWSMTSQSLPLIRCQLQILNSLVVCFCAFRPVSVLPPPPHLHLIWTRSLRLHLLSHNSI